MFTEYEEVTPEGILERVDQRKVFHLALGFYPEIKKYYTNPLRTISDTRPGAFFSWYKSKLYLVDFGDERTHRTCFQAIQDSFGLSYREALLYINQEFELGFEGEGSTIKPKRFVIEMPEEIKEDRRSTIEFTSKEFDKFHRRYWSAYEITKNQLIEDRIYAIKRFKYYSVKAEKWFNASPMTNEVAYAITDPTWEGRIKLCRPLVRDKKKKWINNTSKEDIGGSSNLDFLGDLLIIKKSYKDWRVVTNQGFQSIWIQNEGMLPSIDTLLPLISTFTHILIWFDNDRAGIVAAKKFKEFLSPFHNSVHTTHLPIIRGITDPSDCIKKNKKLFKSFINNIHGKYK